MTNAEINQAVRRKLGINHHDLCHCPDCEKDYCGKIEAAWELVKKMGKYHNVQINYQYLIWPESHCTVFDQGSTKELAREQSNKPSIAIALAFLKVP